MLVHEAISLISEAESVAAMNRMPMRHQAVLLVGLMLLSSLSPTLSMPADAHLSVISDWGSGGHNDSGWLRLDATGADPASGVPAEADLHLNLAPGAEIANLTFEVRVNGSNGTWIEQPQMLFQDTQTAIMDWRGLGGFGQQNDLMGSDPHSSRLTPNSDAGASWLVPGGAEISDLVIEALRPADTFVALYPIDLDISAAATHPTDGRLYLLVGETVIQLDATNNPPVIELAENITGATTMVVDEANGMLLVAVDDNNRQIRAWSLDDSDETTPPASLVSILNTTGGFATAMQVDSGGTVWAATNTADLVAVGQAVPATPHAGDDYATDILEVNGIVYLATLGGGVMRYDTQTSSWLTPWDTQNSLPSDDVVQLQLVNGVLMVGLADAGIVRYNVATNSWLATWNTGNWLNSNEVMGMAIGGEWLQILAGETIHLYNITMGAFGTSRSLSSVGLERGGLDLVAWAAGGSRAPATDTVLVGDGSGALALMVEANPPTHSSTMLLASGPTSPVMHDVVEVGDVVWVAGDDVIDRFDKTTNRWLTPITTGTVNQAIDSDHSSVWVGTSDDGLYRFALNGTLMAHLTTGANLNSNDADDLAFDLSTNTLVVGHSAAGVTLVDTNIGLVSSSWSTGRSDAFSNHVRGVAARSSTAYIASDQGVLRIDITNDTLLSPWRSTGMDDVSYMPVETDGSQMYLGMYGYGVLIFDRVSGDVVDTWQATRGGNGLSDNGVFSLHIDATGDIWVGTADGADRWDGSHWSHITPGGGWSPSAFYDLTSDSTYLYAGTNAGACQYLLSNLQRQDCWNYYSSPEGLPSSWVYAVDLLSNGHLYAGTNYGAGIIDVVNGTVVEVWEAGEATWNALTYEYDDVVYIGLDGIGVARYDRINDIWLQVWDSSNSNNLITDNRVTALIPDRQPHRIWVGGDFGIRLIDLVNRTMLNSFSRVNGQNAPGELVIIGDVLYYSEERWGTSSNDNIYRYNINTMTTMSTLDAGQQISQSGLVYGMGEGPDGMLWIGVAPSGWWGLDAGSIVRYDHANDTWGTNLEATGSILRVNSVYAGECEPLNPQWCHIFASYGEKVHRQFDYNGNLLNEWDDSVIQGPIRSINLYKGLIHFATYDGIARYDMYNDTWATTLTPGNGLPPNSEDTIFDIEIVGDDLWYTTMANSGWNRNSRIFRQNGTTNAWTTWEAGSGNIPEGFGFSMEVCNNVLHVAMARYLSWGTQGGVARYNLANQQWLGQWNQGGGQGNAGLADDDPVALACDETGDVVYVGFEMNDVGITRFQYRNQGNTNGNFLSTISETANGILPDQVFPDGMRWHDGVLMISHTDEGGGSGGISRIPANGGQLGSGIQIDVGTQGSSMEIVPSNSSQVDWLIGRPGGDSGYNRIDILNSTGLHKGAVDILSGLSSGRMLDITFRGNDVWVTCAEDSQQYSASSILRGSLLPNGTIEWVDAYPFVWNIINEIEPINNDLWVTTSFGLYSVNLTSGLISGTPAALHNQMHGLYHSGDDLVIGLMGTTTTSAGFQVYNMTTATWTDGSLIAGLPSNIVRDFVEYDNRIWVSTYGGIGVWNVTSDEWDDSVTTQDGLPSPIVQKIWVEGSDLLLATPSGLVVWDTVSETVTLVEDRTTGLVGTRVNDIAYAPMTTVVSGNQTITYNRTLFLSHNGEGPTRPGATAYSLTGMYATQQYQVDMLPSNDVRAISADWWGVHVATDEEPLVHWNAGSNSMEAGSPSWAFSSWPIQELVSDGTTLLALSQGGVDRVELSTASHSVINSEYIMQLSGGWVGATGVWLTTSDDGVYGYGPAPAFLPVDREVMRRADPLTATLLGTSWDITNSTAPGKRISLIDPSSPMSTPAIANSAAPSGIPIHQQPLTLSSPVDGAAVWLSSHNLNYSGTWNLTDLNPNLAEDFSLAARRGTLTQAGRDLHINLKSPLNGSIEVRIEYDWTRSESPIEVLDLYDRPDDGGGVLIAEWTPSQDHGWAAYHIYLNEGNWSSLPTAQDLATRTPDARVPVWATTIAEITTVNGQPIQDGVDIYALALIEYDDGTLGEPSPIIGPAAATDEIPNPPEWADGGPAEGGADGDLYVEWAKCTAKDHAGTRVWVSTQEIFNAVGLTTEIEDINALANSTVLQLEMGRPYWVALTCVDQTQQHDPANATVIGPVVPVGGIDDGIPPAPVQDIVAYDTPDDGGGRITVEWNPNGEDDCAWHTILIRPSTAEESTPTDALDFGVASIVPDCETNKTIISDWEGVPLVDNTLYWVTVVAYDAWGNGDLSNVTVVKVAPEKNQRGADPPPRVENLSAWDHPDDLGGAVDVSWNASEVDDFGYYVVWASSQPVEDLAATWAKCKDDVTACGAVRINIQHPMGSDGTLSVSIDKALYDGNSVETSQPDDIRPNVPLSVTVTIHDIYDAAFLTSLPSVVVTPIDNRDDIIAPDRLDRPKVTDVPGDNGTAVYVEFTPSDASDIDHYEVYADIIGFTSVAHRQPVMILDRTVSQPIILTEIDGGEALMSGLPIHVAVVPVDTSGNSYTTELNVGTGRAVDNSGDDPGGHLPDVDFTATWNTHGTAIEIEWSALSRTDIRSYRIYVSDQRFENTDEANLAKGGIIGTFWSLEEFNETAQYDNSTHWFITVTAFDGENWKHLVQVREVKPYKAPESIGDDQNSDGEAATNLFDLIDINTMLTILLSMAILTVLLLAVRARRARSRKDAWDMAQAVWGLPQQEDWGDDDGLGPSVDLAGTLLPAAAQISADENDQPPSAASDYSQPPSAASDAAHSGDFSAAAASDASRRLAEISTDLFDEPVSRPSSGDAVLDSLVDDLL